MTASDTVVLGAWLATAVCVAMVLRPRGRARHPMASGAAAPRTGASRRATLPIRPSRRAATLDQVGPDLLDLLVVTLQAGLPPAAALAAVAPHVHPAARAAIDDVGRRVERGDRFVDALDALVDHLGTRVLGLVSAVAAAERWGLPLAPTVDRIADDARLHRRRLAAAAARRLPVRLAVPLVCCTLPSFVCIAIGPLLVGALSSLRSV
ncbi:MAG: type II secretion system F family protein [Actinomycetes bacterium]